MGLDGKGRSSFCLNSSFAGDPAMDRDANPEAAEGKPAEGGAGSSAGFQGFSFSKVGESLLVDGRHVNSQILRASNALPCTVIYQEAVQIP